MNKVLLLLSFAVGLLCQELALAESNVIEPDLVVRPRYASVNDGDVDPDGDGEDNTKNASALTVRTAMGMNVKSLFGDEKLKARIQMMNVSAVADEYNSTSDVGNKRTEYSGVVDPPHTRVTEAYISYKTHGVTILGGRKQLALEDHRFIGTVGWRQMPQTFGGGEIVVDALEGFRFQLNYLSDRQGIKPELDREYDAGSIIAHFTYTGVEGLKASLFHYAIQDTHDTTGLTLNGSFAPVKFMATYATQAKASRTGEGVKAAEHEATYYEVDVGGSMSGVILGANHHVFGEAKGDSVTGFSTPLATLHKFDGWSDVTLPVTANGNAKGFATSSGRIGFTAPWFGKFVAIYHTFATVKDREDYGKETNFIYTRDICEGSKLMLKAASYSKGDDFGNDDVTKFWVMTTHSI